MSTVAGPAPDCPAYGHSRWISYRGRPVTGPRLLHLSASVHPKGHCASGLGRGLHRRTSGRRGSGPRPSCRPTLDPTPGRGTSDNPGTARVGPGRRQPPPDPRALNRRSLPPLTLLHVRCFSCRKHYPFQCERILLSGEFSKYFLGRASSDVCEALVVFCSRPRVEHNIGARVPRWPRVSLAKPPVAS